MDKAQQFESAANRKIARLNLFFTKLFTDKEQLVEEIIELLERASNQYLIEKDFDNSVRCIEKILEYSKEEDKSRHAQNAIKIYIKLKDFDKIEELIQKHFPPDKITYQTIKILKSLIDEYIEIEEFSKVEKYLLMAEKYSEYLDCTVDILKFKSLRASVLLKMDRHKEASELFISTAIEYSDHKFLYNDSIIMFMNAICVELSLGDVVTAKKYYEDALKNNYRFESSREGKLCKNIISSVESIEIKSFVDILFEYDSITPLTPMLTSLLLKTKQQITNI